MSRRGTNANVTKTMPSRECPMCGSIMRLEIKQIATRVPGNPAPTRHTSAEWICPDCDYFEEAEEER